MDDDVGRNNPKVITHKITKFLVNLAVALGKTYFWDRIIGLHNSCLTREYSQQLSANGIL